MSTPITKKKTLYMMNSLLTYNLLDNLLGCFRCHMSSRFSPSQLPFLMLTRKGWMQITSFDDDDDYFNLFFHHLLFQ